MYLIFFKLFYKCQKIGKIEKVSNEIRKRREELGYYQEDVIEKLKKEGVDISISGLSRIESMERQKLDTNLLIALSKVLKKDFIEMLGHNPKKQESNVSDEIFTSFIQVPIYGMASAGNGLIEMDENIEEIEYISIPNINKNVKKRDFACRVRGDSMERHYQADQLVLNQLIQVENKISQLLEIKDFLQSIVTESEHNEEECKAIEGLKSECNL